MKHQTICALAVLAVASSALADEIRLKDGTKIVGTIVGFENNSFKVQTSYGFALVQKDKIAAIIPSEAKPAAKKEAAAPEPKKPAAPSAAARAAQPAAPAPARAVAAKKEAAPEPKKPAAPPAAARAAQPAAPAPARAVAAKKEAAPEPKKPAAPSAAARAAQPAAPAPARAVAAKKEALRPSAAVPIARLPAQVSSPRPATPTARQTASSAATVPAPAVAPPAVAAGPPPPMREEVQGNFYINQTYGFRVYKPPGWQIIEGAQKALPSAIVAMGTSDETTLLVIGRQRMTDSLEAHAAATERQLREIYEHYRRLPEQHTGVAGLPALAQRYQGAADGHDWSGVVLTLARGNNVFTILGMTYADSDLIQIQENVIARTIASLEFTQP